MSNEKGRNENRLYSAGGRDLRGGNSYETSRGYLISTADVQVYLQGKVNALCAANNINQPINVRVNSILLSNRGSKRQFVPFLIVLPESVRKQERERGDGENDIDPIFETENRSSRLELKDCFANLLRTFQYSKNDLGYYRSNKGRRDNCMNMNHYDNLVKLAQPRLVDGGRNTKVVSQWLDPIRVFYDMAFDKEHPRDRYLINVTQVEKINGYQYMYKFERELTGLKSGDSAEYVSNVISKSMFRDSTL